MYMHSRNNRFIAFAIIVGLAAQPVAAFQFGGLLGGGSSRSDDSENHCNTMGESAGRSIIGGILGDAARSLGIPTYVPSTEFSDVLATEIACRLDPEEQEKAAAATDEATRGGQVGATAEWTSDTRPGVRGRSTVTGRSQASSGRDCLEVTDVIIVEGEETTVPKTMCRVPPSRRYTRTA
ncbi:hypothetical protein [Parasphingopyxis sp. CP4]|uniref:hypothetical protein n=1 Tax=Parasphingopyxis sp. CP4 TaxID=2724527 RepID=UPI00210818B5|nr:hypothetical protein [Parasphingopyxis sp. CP4]